MRNKELLQDLKVMVCGEYTYIMPKKHYDITKVSDLHSIKRAGSVFVIKGDNIEKNILNEF